MKKKTKKKTNILNFKIKNKSTYKFFEQNNFWSCFKEQKKIQKKL